MSIFKHSKARVYPTEARRLSFPCPFLLCGENGFAAWKTANLPEPVQVSQLKLKWTVDTPASFAREGVTSVSGRDFCILPNSYRPLIVAALSQYGVVPPWLSYYTGCVVLEHQLGMLVVKSPYQKRKIKIINYQVFQLERQNFMLQSLHRAAAVIQYKKNCHLASAYAPMLCLTSKEKDCFYQMLDSNMCDENIVTLFKNKGDCCDYNNYRDIFVLCIVE
ncbi:hypothetical protein HELRODRAFT_162975 [Helobdella robusta]|uniref:Uncharacterized protein n=1 Tax=Helobdella robusta TaxID=6412 RepID=T1ETH0_HELRO|nr:hypothetical protein HELRODRAFT_162975 [Helobdella robusta]ESN99427.1 hypothetical protein HELRODRAFT_162975 [Helobdella robusta]